VALGCAVLAALGAGATDETIAGSAAPTVTGLTQPSDKASPSFAGPGIISTIAVKEGDIVKKGQLIMSEDSEMDRLELAALKIESDSHLTIDFAQADYEAKDAIRAKLQNAVDHNVANPSEFEEAKANAIEAKIRIDVAGQEIKQKQIEADKQAAKIRKMDLLSPIDGVVRKLNLHLGEVVDPNKVDGACMVLQNDPLWVEVKLPSIQAAALKSDETLMVKYADEDKFRPAKVILFDPLVDSASDTQIIRLEMPNPEKRPPGLHVIVRLPDRMAGMAAGN
jgi:multidrug efflux pump subunit AcrA (membrane-fusion protein)